MTRLITDRAIIHTVATPKKIVPDIAIAFLIGVLTAILLLSLRPLADIPMNDDFSWARSAQSFARTGKIVYNGWGNPILLPHIIVGGILIKLFGFSHIILGAFGIFSGALFAGVTYLLARACDVSRLLSIFIVGLAVLNPVFLGCAPTFMSDVPSAFLYTGALLAFVKSIYLLEGETRYRLRPTPLVIAAILAFLAGANRQILWASLLVAFAVGFWYVTPADRLRRLGPALIAIVLGGVVLSAWFAAQPYSVTVSLEAISLFARSAPDLLFWHPYKFISFVGLAALPITAPIAWRTWREQTKPIPQFVACLAAGIIPFIFFLVPQTSSQEYWNGIWRLTAYGQYATNQGVMVGGPAGYQLRPPMMPEFVGTLLNILGATGIGVLLWCLFVTHKTRSFAANVLLTGALAQIVLPLPWFASGAIFDRYLISLIPILLIALVARPTSNASQPAEQPNYAWKPFLLGTPLAILYAFGGITFALEYFGYTQARGKLYAALKKQNIAPEHIDAGVETSGDTQIALGKYINNVNIKNPPDAFDPDKIGTCVFGAGYFPVMDAQYLLCTVSPAPDLAGISSAVPLLLDPEPVMQESYSSPIAPNERTIYVYRVQR